MFKKFTIAVLSLLMVSSVAFASGAKDIKLPGTMKSGTSDLLLNGSGIRIKKIGFMKLDLYVAGLYLTQKSTDVETMTVKDEGMAIKLHITSKMINGKRMSKATNQGFEQATGGNTAPIKAEIGDMINVFKDGIKVGDVYDLVYVPQTGTQIFKNGELKTTIKGLEFKKALFGIWVGNKAVQADLKKEMAGA